MVKLQVTKKRLAAVAAVLVIAGFVGVTIYEQFELRGLRARMHTLENNVNDLGMVYDGTADESKVDYEEISKESATVRVVDLGDMNYKYDESTEQTYKSQKVLVYKLKITNDIGWQYDYSEGQIKGKTASGQLIDPLFASDIHPDDLKGSVTLSLAPGGQGEIYVYLPADKGITGLYYTDFGGAI
jgi:hypothetical protein